LAAALKEQLSLPEIGTVELRLYFSATGKLSKVEVLSSENETNSRYLIEVLEKVHLPPFPRELRGAKGTIEPIEISFRSS
jgi:hypothetical protein